MELSWMDAGGGYTLALDEGTLVCRNKKGKQLAVVPAKVKKSDAGEQLLALRDWMVDHAQQCQDQVERWMQRSLEVPVVLIEQVWEDLQWRTPLHNILVHPPGNPDEAGFLRHAAVAEGLGVVDLDGETSRITTETVVIPHPILIEELDEWRELAADLSLSQGVPQLHRETTERAAGLEGQTVGDYKDGAFEQLRHIHGKCRRLGYKVTGGFAVCPVWEDGRITEARFWIGADAPDSEACTGDLLWVDGEQKALKLAVVGPVAYSEGHRMAAAIYAGRIVKEEQAP